MSRAVLFLTLTALTLAVKRRKEEVCTLGRQTYALGQTWHPTLTPLGENNCVNCTCLKGGKVNCEAIACQRPDCLEPKVLPGVCCPSCDLDKESLKEKDNQSQGCDFHGELYANGQRFPSQNTGLRPTRQDQCVTCVCSDGYVFCQLKTCLPSNCQSLLTVPDDCCPHCADETEPPVGQDVPYSVFQQQEMDKISVANCESPMGTHANGSSWKPVLDTYGEIGCVVCTCLNGKMTCERVGCKNESSLPCDHPSRVANTCCPQCPATPSSGLSTPSPDKAKGEVPSSGGKAKRKQRGRKRNKRKRKKKGKKDKKKDRKKDRRKKNRKCKASDPGEVRSDRKANATSVAAILKELCLPRKTDRLLYRLQQDGRETLAIDGVKDMSLEVYQWTLDTGQLVNTVPRSTNQTEQFRQSALCSYIIGATNQSGARRLLKKLTSSLKKCHRRRKNKKKRCTSNTLHNLLLRDRRLKPVPTAAVCGQ